MNKPEGFPETVWVAEAWEFGERLERIVHLTEEDARHDIKQSYIGQEVEYKIEKEKLYTGTEFMNND